MFLKLFSLLHLANSTAAGDAGQMDEMMFVKRKKKIVPAHLQNLKTVCYRYLSIYAAG